MPVRRASDAVGRYAGSEGAMPVRRASDTAGPCAGSVGAPPVRGASDAAGPCAGSAGALPVRRASDAVGVVGRAVGPSPAGAVRALGGARAARVAGGGGGVGGASVRQGARRWGRRRARRGEQGAGRRRCRCRWQGRTGGAAALCGARAGPRASADARGVAVPWSAVLSPVAVPAPVSHAPVVPRSPDASGAPGPGRGASTRSVPDGRYARSSPPPPASGPSDAGRGRPPGPCPRKRAGPSARPAGCGGRRAPGCLRCGERGAGGGGGRRGALPCSCTPVSSSPGRSSSSAAGVSLPGGPARTRPGHRYPHDRRVIPPGRPGRPCTAVRARHSTACGAPNGNQSAGPRRHLPGTSPYPAVIRSGRLRS